MSVVTATASSELLPQTLTRWPGYLMSFVADHTGERFDTLLAARGVNTRHVSVLAVIDAEGPMSQRALGRRLRIDKSPMVLLVDDLERLGYAQRRRSDSDRRVQDIHLTRGGRATLRHTMQIAEVENTRTYGVLDDGEREQLHDLLMRVAAQVVDQEDAGC
jgi:DNA-binding MarR family transcriptional regulator